MTDDTAQQNTARPEKIHTSISDFLNTLVTKALEMGVSDIHFEPRDTNVVVRYRVDGILREILSIDKNFEQPLIFKIKIAAKLKTDEHFTPQDGRIRFVINGKKLDTRISILPTTKGEKVVMRLLSAAGKSFKLEDLGLMDRDLETVKRSFNKPYGTILAVGPTGSGKTTTLYSILQNLNSPGVNITTIEDPVEYDLSGVNHIQVNEKTGMTFATGLRSILRQDPNIIMVGEIRDPDTANIAINAAMTGHLVLSTLHTNDAVTTIPRLLEMGVEKFLIASTLNVVIAQRLARRLCTKCRVPYTLNAVDINELKKIRPDIAQFIKVGDTFYKEVGCPECTKTGFKGRIGLYEILQFTDTLRSLITTGASTDEIFKAARNEGLNLIVEDGIKKLHAGIISISELLKVTAIKE